MRGELAAIAACGIFAFAGLAWAEPASPVSNGGIQKVFAAGSAELGDQGKANLRRVAAILRLPRYTTVTVQIAGHTDKTESTAFNMSLSKRRADAVKAFLVSLGATANRIETVGYGNTKLAKRVVIARLVK